MKYVKIFEEFVNEATDELNLYLDPIKKALPELESLIFKQSKVKVKLAAELGRDNINITSNDLSNQLSPLGKTVFKEIQLYFWGWVLFWVVIYGLILRYIIPIQMGVPMVEVLYMIV